MSILTIISVITQVASGFGLFDWAASRVSRVRGAVDRVSEPLITGIPSTTLIVSRLEFLGGLLLVAWNALEPTLLRVHSGDELSYLGMVLVISGFVKAVLRYWTSHEVQ